ncbi:unnamed protein product [Cuscuta campestris]|uniref:Glycosyl transferase 48 domain-containing protein n=1 Tax=Cuscuta campestris TaxID=132261 RepID=A0A484MMD8_9ASTE|nr:unnamed protein product [Cuscuta campestris]
MNQVRNLLEEFYCDHGVRPPTILGVKEHVFTGSVSSLASFMSNQESSFVTLGQRVLANPLKVRMHYGHPDVFDRLFHITRGGISKASRVINISEDIFSGFNSTLCQDNVTHHEYLQVGKGRDVGLNQIAFFEGKVAGGNGEQVLSRDVYSIVIKASPRRRLGVWASLDAVTPDITSFPSSEEFALKLEFSLGFSSGLELNLLTSQSPIIPCPGS